jgi:hypothetical protein
VLLGSTSAAQALAMAMASRALFGASLYVVASANARSVNALEISAGQLLDIADGVAP